MLTIAVFILIYMSSWFVLSLIRHRNDLADIAWGLGFIGIAIISSFNNNFISSINNIIVVLVTLWGLRLAIHILSRNINKHEDYRYKKWREDWGKNWIIRSYLQVFLLQGFFMFLITLPIILTGFYSKHSSLTWINYLGMIIWLLGFVFETIGDWQLTQFKNNPKNKGKVMKYGLWRYSRHPNYFGEVTLWWGIFLITISDLVSLIGMIGPLTITLLILKVSGIPLLEAKYVGNEEFEQYKKQTSTFFPLPVKK